MAIMSFLKSLSSLKNLEEEFTTRFGLNKDKVEKAGKVLADTLPKAMEIVKEIDEKTPNKKVEEVVSIYNKYGLNFLNAPSTNSYSTIADALLNLGTFLLQRSLGDKAASIPINILRTAVSVAVTLIHANKLSAAPENIKTK